MTYWIDFILVLIPRLLFTTISILPLGLGILATIRYLKKGLQHAYIRSLWGSIAAGIVSLLILFGSLFGDDLSSSSTAALVFLFAPIYATIAYVAGYGLSVLATDKSESPVSISSTGWLPLLIPISILLALMVGILKISIQGNDNAIAYGASNPRTLTRVYKKSLQGEADPFSIPLGLAQNPNTPPEILQQLTLHEDPAIRVHAVKHSATPIDVVSSLRNDSTSFVRKAVERRLGQEQNNIVKPIIKPQLMPDSSF